MRKFKGTILIIILISILISCGPKKMTYKAGTYEGMGQGHHGLIKVEITTDEYEIKEINIIDQQEVPVVSDIVYETIPPEVIKKNSVEVDVVAGATLTSNGLLDAIKDALNKAKVQEE